MSGLLLAPTLTLPLDMPVHRMAFIGTYNSGKSYSAMKCAEEMLKAGLQFVAIDPMGIWWGMRLSADGTREGFPITIFGGQHGDIPIREEDGALVAEAVVREKISAIIDVSSFETEAEKIRFVHRFGQRLFHLKKTNPSAVHIFLEEADDFVPQNAVGGDAHMIHVWNKIWKQGGNYGIGGSLISQRPQDLNKKALELSACYFIFNVTGANALDAVGKTLKGVPEVAQLPEFQKGECLVYSPAWLQKKERIRFFARVTFHARFDPNSTEPSEQKIDRTLTPMAVESLKAAFAEAVQEADENDPKKLRARIKELEAAIDSGVAEPSYLQIQQAVENATSPLIQKLDYYETLIAEAREGFDETLSRLRVLYAQFNFSDALISEAHKVRTTPPPAALEESKQTVLQKAPALKQKQQQIIDAIAWWQSVGVEPIGSQIGAVAQIDASGGYFSNLVGPLVTGGLITRTSGRFSLTEVGKAAAKPLPATPTLSEYHAMLKARVRSLKSSNGKTIAILEQVIKARRRTLRTDEIGASVGVDHTGGYFSNSIGPLSTMGLITRDRGEVRATNLLFPEGLK